MGYTTTFTGSVTVEPPLNGPEMAYLRAFSDARHELAEGTPGYNCNWVPTADGTGIEWSGMEKFCDADDWMRYLIDEFLKPGASLLGRPGGPEFRHFTCNHVVAGRIEAQGEDPDDRWTLVVADNIATRVDYPKLAERMDKDGALKAAVELLKAEGVTPGQYAELTGQDY